MLDENRVRTKYRKLLLEEFVEEYHLWDESVKRVNILISHINTTTGKELSTITYDEFCQNTEARIHEYLDSMQFANIFKVELSDVRNIYPTISLLGETQEYKKMYNKISSDIVKFRISSLESKIHEHCIFSMLKELTQDDFPLLENSLRQEYLYSL
jgi:hypothetical protein